jgi:hypothetical protein
MKCLLGRFECEERFVQKLDLGEDLARQIRITLPDQFLDPLQGIAYSPEVTGGFLVCLFGGRKCGFVGPILDH